MAFVVVDVVVGGALIDLFCFEHDLYDLDISLFPLYTSTSVVSQLTTHLLNIFPLRLSLRRVSLLQLMLAFKSFI